LSVWSLACLTSLSTQQLVSLIEQKNGWQLAEQVGS
jgi:hypothetical protein